MDRYGHRHSDGMGKQEECERAIDRQSQLIPGDRIRGRFCKERSAIEKLKVGPTWAECDRQEHGKRGGRHGDQANAE